MATIKKPTRRERIWSALKSTPGWAVWELFLMVMFLVNIVFAAFMANDENYARASYYLLFAVLFFLYLQESGFRRRLDRIQEQLWKSADLHIATSEFLIAQAKEQQRLNDEMLFKAITRPSK